MKRRTAVTSQCLSHAGQRVVHVSYATTNAGAQGPYACVQTLCFMLTSTNSGVMVYAITLQYCWLSEEGRQIELTE